MANEARWLRASDSVIGSLTSAQSEWAQYVFATLREQFEKAREEAFEEIALALDADAKACREDACDYDAECAEHYAKLVRELAKKPAPKVRT